MKKAWGRSNKKASSGHLRRLIVASSSRVSGNPSNVHSSATSQKTWEDNLRVLPNQGASMEVDETRFYFKQQICRSSRCGS